MNKKRILLATILAAGTLPATQSSGQQAPPQGPPPQGQRPPMRSPIPDAYTNLQVLPKNITKPELVNVMKSFALTFEKRCSFCHVATDDLSEADFASDEKETKKKARQLLQFIRDAQKEKSSTKP